MIYSTHALRLTLPGNGSMFRPHGFGVEATTDFGFRVASISGDASVGGGDVASHHGARSPRVSLCAIASDTSAGARIVRCTLQFDSGAFGFDRLASRMVHAGGAVVGHRFA